MKVFKFGGASVKDAESVKNVVRVLKHEGIENTLIVISAMGKMTNAFEKIVDSYYSKNDNLAEQIEFARNFHLEIIEMIKYLFDTRSQLVANTFFPFRDILDGTVNYYA